VRRLPRAACNSFGPLLAENEPGQDAKKEVFPTTTLEAEAMSVWIRTSTAFAILFAVSLVAARLAHARDPDGRYANSPLRGWFEQLASKKGRCCSDADGRALSDVDWTSHDGHYRVLIDGEWVDVPDDALITEPNRAGPTMVWPTWLDGHPQVRCFLPGSMG
jgi:hypothetical protein